jgi:O-acetyl-ADP-ribose deacetylase (regulator of RNase III)
MITKYIQGDITETELKYIAHGVNCQNKMGSGVAKALYEKFPEVKREYHTFNEDLAPEELLGLTDYIHSDNADLDKIFINCYTQLNYGYDAERYVNYAAVANCFRLMACDGVDKVAIPKIGCGLAGGNWTFMEQLINDTVGDKIEIWVYDNNTLKASGKNDNA